MLLSGAANRFIRRRVGFVFFNAAIQALQAVNGLGSHAVFQHVGQLRQVETVRVFFVFLVKQIGGGLIFAVPRQFQRGFNGIDFSEWHNYANLNHSCCGARL